MSATELPHAPQKFDARDHELAQLRAQQRATAQILRVISTAPTDPQPVLDMIVENARLLCDAKFSGVFRYDGELVHLLTYQGLTAKGAKAYQQSFPRPAARDSAIGRAILTRELAHIPDVRVDPEYGLSALAQFGTMRCIVAVPMLREGCPVGGVVVWRSKPEPFLDSQIELLKSFADQALIALDNARLFQTLEMRNEEVTEALEQQTAASEILKVISSSPTDVQPVFDMIADSAKRLCDGEFSVVFRFDGELLHLVANNGLTPVGQKIWAKTYPRTAGNDHAIGRAILSGDISHISDVEADSEYSYRALAKAVAYRSIVAVPILHEGRALGGIVVTRSAAGFFPGKQVELLKIFADQAAIAIENVRLFQTLAARNKEVTESLEQRTATSEILQVISSSPTDVQPVFEAIVASAARLCDAEFSAVARFEDRLLHLTALNNLSQEEVEAFHRLFPRVPDRSFIMGRTFVDARPVHVEDVMQDPDYDPRSLNVLQKVAGYRTFLGVPILRDGVPIGTIGCARRQVKPFTEAQIALVTTFAAQAVIAIENVRLFQELEARNQEITRTLEQQTATSNVLQVISSSPTDVQPVFEAIVESSTRLCDAEFSGVAQLHGGLLHLVAISNLSQPEAEAFQSLFPRQPSRDFFMGRAVVDVRPVHIEDVLKESDYDPQFRQVVQKATAYRSCLAIPMLRDGMPTGVIICARRHVEPFTTAQIELVKTFADQGVIAVENVRLFQELEARNRDISEALEQQTASTEVLDIISRSTFDLQPVLETLIEKACKVVGADRGAIFRPDGDTFPMAAAYGASPEFREFLQQNPIRPGRGSVTGRVILEQRTVHVPDVLADPEYTYVNRQVVDQRTTLGVPLLREGTLVGVITIWKEGKVSPFTERQIELITAFAAQAVIAIENVRLFRELQARNKDIGEALEQQLATTEVLKAISRSTFELQPVLETLVENATRLCGASHGHIFRTDGNVLRFAVDYGATPRMKDYFERQPLSVGHGSVAGTAAVERRTVHVHDVLTVPGYQWGELAELEGWRTILAVPMLKGDVVIGVIAIWKTKVEPFTEKQIELVTTFADQATIAIENVRLFQELEDRNRDMTEALEQQTATSEVLKVISSSPTDIQPVFDMIAERATRLCRGQICVVNRYDGGLIHLVSHYGLAGEQLDAYRKGYPRPARPDSANGRAILTREIAHIPDIEADPGYRFADLARAVRYRSIVAVPLLRDGTAIGSIAVSRSVAAPFPEKQIELVKTFADQAVIAIENVRLFQELEARTQQLTSSVEELKALGEIGQTISSSLDLDTVLQTIVARAVELSKTDAGTIYEFDEEEKVFEPRANYGMSEEMVQALRGSRLRLGDPHSGLSRAAAARSAVQISDLSKEPEHVLPFLQRAGFHALLAVPLLREERIIGGLVVRRKAAGELPRETLELVQTFATQSALAIENARLFRQIKEKSDELEIASQHKSHFVANMSHELRTPLNAIIGYSEMLEEEAEDAGQAGFLPDLKNIRVAGKHLLGLINEILDLSKIEAGKMELFLEQFDASTLVRDVVATVQPLVETNGNTLQVDCAADLGAMTADLTKVRQSLFNLLSNASKFTKHGTITLEVERTTVNEAPWLSFRIHDTGIGMTQEQMAKLFQAFSQADASTTRQYGGTGLGLAISRQFCQMMGGDITVESDYGNGSTFTIKLPAEVTEGDVGETPRAETLHVPALTESQQRPTVLVIDDDPAVRDLMQRFLERESLHMIAAANGKEGLRLAQAEHPDAITLDVLMPDMDGWSVLASLKADPMLADIPVIMITIADQRHGGYALGAADYLTKPIEWKRLTAILQAHLPSNTTEHVLIVEDDARTRKMLRKRLEKQGWPVTEAENGRLALDRLSEATPGVVLLDLMMPEMDGFQFLDRMRADERWRTIPVIVITAKDLTAEDKRKLNGYVEKILEKGTYSSESLLSEVCSLLSVRVNPQHSRSTEGQ